MYGKLIFSIGTFTEAMQAKKALNRIAVSVVRLDSHRSRNGCSFGIEFPQNEIYSVAHVLTQMGIQYSAYTIR